MGAGWWSRLPAPGRDIWRPFLLELPMAELLRRGTLDGLDPVWLPDSPPGCFLADPFGFRHDGRLHVLAERFDYRDRHGTIELLVLDEKGSLLDRRSALREPWHLSYPVTVEENGDRFMLPEAFRSGASTLYRMDPDDPARWRPDARLDLDAVPVDATPVFRDGLWWLFYSPAEPKAARQERLHLAWAERLRGPWHPHPGNPVRHGRHASRPGGTPSELDGVLVLPTQDCSRTYGGAIRPLHIHVLHPDRFEAEAGAPIRAGAGLAPFTTGLHTMAACGGLTLLDAKRRTGWLPDARRPPGPHAAG